VLCFDAGQFYIPARLMADGPEFLKILSLVGMHRSAEAACGSTGRGYGGAQPHKRESDISICQNVKEQQWIPEK
jgi:hypothetical protein